MGSIPRHSARIPLTPVSGGTDVFRCELPAGSAPGGMRLIVEIDAHAYPLEEHCCYMRQQDPSGPYTFEAMTFEPEPPGIRVGPWPGWRRIPSLPDVHLSLAGRELHPLPHFWGDELTARRLRMVAWTEGSAAGMLFCTVADRRLTPVAVEVYEDALPDTHHHRTGPVVELIGIHPRLLLRPEDLPGLRARATGSHRREMDLIRALLDGPPEPHTVTPSAKLPAGPERLRPEDRAMLTALVAILDPSPPHQRTAVDAYRAFIAATQDPSYEPLNIDTQSGEILFVLSLVYDWLYDVLGPQDRAAARAWLDNVATRVRGHLGPGRRDYAQAHYLGCALGLLAFGCVFYEDHPLAPSWVGELRGSFATVLAMLPDDGFHPHGPSLWVYEYGFLLRWLEIFRVWAGEDLWSHPHWRHAADFRAATLSPDGLHGITFGDPQFRVGGDAWCHYLIAARTGSRLAMRTAHLLADGPHEGVDFRSIPPRRRVYEFLFRDPSIEPAPGPPSSTYCEDGGQVIVRGGRGDVFTFRSGPPIGITRYREGERGGYGHADPCNGSFLWYTDGRMAVAGPGPVYRRDTALQNVVTVNGQGQIGDGMVWMPDFLPPAVLAARPGVTWRGNAAVVSVDLTSAYLPHLGVRLMHRTMWIDPDGWVTGIDEVSCAAPSSLEWNLHSAAPFTRFREGGPRGYRAVMGDHALTVFLLDPDGGVCTTGPTEFVPAYPHDGMRDHFLRWAFTGTGTRFIWCLTVHAEPHPPEMRRDGQALVLLFRNGQTLRYENRSLRCEEEPC